MHISYIALGSNITPRYGYLDQAIKMLTKSENICVKKVSSVYETDPVGVTDQASFLNMVIEVETTLTSIELLDVCQRIEQTLGRKRIIRWGPRTIDLDILLYNQENMKTERLVIPHPRMHERAFVLVPLHEINPIAYLPIVEYDVTNALSYIPEEDKQSVIRWGSYNLEAE